MQQQPSVMVITVSEMPIANIITENRTFATTFCKSSLYLLSLAYRLISVTDDNEGLVHSFEIVWSSPFVVLLAELMAIAVNVIEIIVVGVDLLVGDGFSIILVFGASDVVVIVVVRVFDVT